MERTNPYMPMPAVIDSVTVETPTIKTYVVRPERPFAFEAGQFAELSIPGSGEAPFTPSSSPEVSDELAFTVMRVGHLTERLHGMMPGDRIGLRGPLGQPYPLDAFRGRDILIAGGGVGLAPLRALLFALFTDPGCCPNIILRYGARTPADIVYREALERKWGQNGLLDVMTTVDAGDDAWEGHVGVVTTILDKDTIHCDPATAVAVVCGPPVMMRFTTFKLLETGFPPSSIYLSMEKNMSCGIGKCGHCRVGTWYACNDGPVFSYDNLQSAPKVFA